MEVFAKQHAKLLGEIGDIKGKLEQLGKEIAPREKELSDLERQSRKWRKELGGASKEERRADVLRKEIADLQKQVDEQKGRLQPLLNELWELENPPPPATIGPSSGNPDPVRAELKRHRDYLNDLRSKGVPEWKVQLEDINYHLIKIFGPEGEPLRDAMAGLGGAGLKRGGPGSAPLPRGTGPRPPGGRSVRGGGGAGAKPPLPGRPGGRGRGGIAPTKPGGTGKGKAKITLDLFGGKNSQNPGAINVDKVAKEGVQADARKLPFKSAVADEIIASNPYIKKGSGAMDWLPEATRTLKQGGRIYINFTKGNKFGKLPDAATLDKLGLRVVQEAGPLDSRFAGQVFRRTDGTVIPNESVKTTILEKVN
jgi:hypothetical protein